MITIEEFARACSCVLLVAPISKKGESRRGWVIMHPDFGPCCMVVEGFEGRSVLRSLKGGGILYDQAGYFSIEVPVTASYFNKMKRNLAVSGHWEIAFAEVKRGVRR